MTCPLRFGDAVHLASLLNVLAFAVAVACECPFFDREWKREGFCIANANTPYWTSHDLCLYADVVLAAAMTVVYRSLRDTSHKETNELIERNIAGMLVHGLGHGLIAKALRDDVVPTHYNATGWEAINMMSAMDALRIKLPFVLFFLVLLKSAMPNASWRTILRCTVLSSVCWLFFTTQFGFTYIQTVLFMAFELNQLWRPEREKGFVYAAYPVLVGIPIGTVGWIESLQCSNGVMDLGGHLIYDISIPVCLAVFYLVCWLRTNTSSKMMMKPATRRRSVSVAPLGRRTSAVLFSQ
jgi:hypothetical protein